ncbi:hypothetical protein MBLNU230_g3586t1 [Neophaeotheca triangularis]
MLHQLAQAMTRFRNPAIKPEDKATAETRTPKTARTGAAPYAQLAPASANHKHDQDHKEEQTPHNNSNDQAMPADNHDYPGYAPTFATVRRCYHPRTPRGNRANRADAYPPRNGSLSGVALDIRSPRSTKESDLEPNLEKYGPRPGRTLNLTPSLVGKCLQGQRTPSFVAAYLGDDEKGSAPSGDDSFDGRFQRALDEDSEYGIGNHDEQQQDPVPEGFAAGLAAQSYSPHDADAHASNDNADLAYDAAVSHVSDSFRQASICDIEDKNDSNNTKDNTNTRTSNPIDFSHQHPAVQSTSSLLAYEYQRALINQYFHEAQYKAHLAASHGLEAEMRVLMWKRSAELHSEQRKKWEELQGRKRERKERDEGNVGGGVVNGNGKRARSG